MQGHTERFIRTVRAVLQPLLWNFGLSLCDETFRTFLAEAEAIVNSRPLTTDNLSDAKAPEPLTPSHILTLKPKTLLPPPGKFSKVDQYVSRRWRRVQYLANEFWFRWRKEYLQSLQTRVKWNHVQRNMQPGDVVIMKQSDLPRNVWKLARVVSTQTSDDGLVRKVRLAVGTSNLDANGKRLCKLTYLERPIHNLVLLVPAKYGSAF